jgi:uncharacterized membrane protein
MVAGVATGRVARSEETCGESRSVCHADAVFARDGRLLGHVVQPEQLNRIADDADVLEVGHTMIGNLGGPMSVLMPSAVLSGIIVCTVLFRRRHTRSGGLALVSMLLLLSAMAITLTVNVPIDRRIQTWTTVTVPSDWMATRDRWEYYHGLRTLISVLAFACLLWSTLETTDVAASDHAARPGGA